jgi:hypothetical protein
LCSDQVITMKILGNYLQATPKSVAERARAGLRDSGPGFWSLISSCLIFLSALDKLLYVLVSKLLLN